MDILLLSLMYSRNLPGLSHAGQIFDILILYFIIEYSIFDFVTILCDHKVISKPRQKLLKCVKVLRIRPFCMATT